MISPLSLGDLPRERWTEDSESAFPSLKLPGVESPRRKSSSLRFVLKSAHTAACKKARRSVVKSGALCCVSGAMVSWERLQDTPFIYLSACMEQIFRPEKLSWSYLSSTFPFVPMLTLQDEGIQLIVCMQA